MLLLVQVFLETNSKIYVVFNCNFLSRYNKIHDFKDEVREIFSYHSLVPCHEKWNTLMKREKLMLVFLIYAKAFSTNLHSRIL